MLTDLEAGRIGGIVVWRSDRFTRQPRELERFLELAEETGRWLYSVTEPFDDSAMGKHMLRTFVNNHNFESAVKSERIRAQKKEAALAGLPLNGGPRPFGFEADRFTIRESEADLIKEAAERILAGESTYALEQEWYRRGVRGPHGNAIGSSYLRNILLSPRTRGQREHLGQVVADGTWEAILVPEVADRLRVVLAGRRTSSRTAGYNRRRYLLTGFVHCGVEGCGGKLIAQRLSNGAGSYVCIRSALTSACGKLRVVARSVDDEVARQLFVIVNDRKVARAARPPRSSREAELRAAIAKDEAEIENLAVEWAEHPERPIAGWRAAEAVVMSRLEPNRRRLEAELALEVEAQVDVEGLADRWKGMDLLAKRAVLEVWVKRVTIKPVGKGAGRFDPDRVDVEWTPRP